MIPLQLKESHCSLCTSFPGLKVSLLPIHQHCPLLCQPAGPSPMHTPSFFLTLPFPGNHQDQFQLTRFSSILMFPHFNLVHLSPHLFVFCLHIHYSIIYIIYELLPYSLYWSHSALTNSYFIKAMASLPSAKTLPVTPFPPASAYS